MSCPLNSDRECLKVVDTFRKKRGPAPAAKNPLAAHVAVQEQAIVRLTARAERAEALVALPKRFRRSWASL